MMIPASTAKVRAANTRVRFPKIKSPSHFLSFFSGVRGLAAAASASPAKFPVLGIALNSAPLDEGWPAQQLRAPGRHISLSHYRTLPAPTGDALLTLLLCRPQGLACRVLDTRRPGLVDQGVQAVRQRHVIQLNGHFAAVLVGPIEELKDLESLCRLVLHLVYENKGRA